MLKPILAAAAFTAAIVGATVPANAQTRPPTCHDYDVCVADCRANDPGNLMCINQCAFIFSPAKICAPARDAGLHQAKAKITPLPTNALKGVAKPTTDKATAGA